MCNYRQVPVLTSNEVGAFTGVKSSFKRFKTSVKSAKADYHSLAAQRCPIIITIDGVTQPQPMGIKSIVRPSNRVKRP